MPQTKIIINVGRGGGKPAFARHDDSSALLRGFRTTPVLSCAVRDAGGRDTRGGYKPAAAA
ncbi:hypothetical protein Srut_56880 [Streptomyces rutgersensis]|nr:hypothetical protein Srut_56880 [Streptomyces rutgersensis]